MADWQLQGHTSGVYCVKFLPQCGNSQIVSSASDRQARHKTRITNHAGLCI